MKDTKLIIKILISEAPYSLQTIFHIIIIYIARLSLH